MGAHLLPRLRCHFAEFLNQRSLTRLRILSSPTCVGLRYGHLGSSLEAFLGSMGSTSWRGCSPLPHHLSVFALEETDLPVSSTYGLVPGLPTPGWPTLLRPPITHTLPRWYGH